jgi:hypothetical protein
MSNDTPDDDKNRKGEDAPQEAEAQATAVPTPRQAASKPKPAADEKNKKRKSRRLSAALEVAASPPTPDQLAYLASEFILCTLPHSDPGDVRLWSRTNGAFTLALQPGVDPKTGESYGLPYGPLPRLLLAWLTWEAKRLGDPDIYLGESFAEFMEKLGLSYYTGGGCRGDAARLREQMRRLFHCLITFRYEQDGHSFVVRLLPVEQSQALWDSHARTAAERHGDFLRIRLGQKFFDAITRSTGAAAWA